jgi:hypothetical protein
VRRRIDPNEIHAGLVCWWIDHIDGPIAVEITHTYWCCGWPVVDVKAVSDGRWVGCGVPGPILHTMQPLEQLASVGETDRD